MSIEASNVVATMKQALDDGYCKACDGDQCTAKHGCVAASNPPFRCQNCESLERQNAELDLRLAEQDQAPFGFLTNKRQRISFEPNATGLSNMPMTIDWKIPLYGSPQPQRTWVGLTDEEIQEAIRGLMITRTGHLQGTASTTDFARAIEAKLKEKNT